MMNKRQKELPLETNKAQNHENQRLGLTEVNDSIAKANAAFGRLRGSIWDQR